MYLIRQDFEAQEKRRRQSLRYRQESAEARLMNTNIEAQKTSHPTLVMGTKAQCMDSRTVIMDYRTAMQHQRDLGKLQGMGNELANGAMRGAAQACRQCMQPTRKEKHTCGRANLSYPDPGFSPGSHPYSDEGRLNPIPIPPPPGLDFDRAGASMTGLQDQHQDQDENRHMAATIPSPPGLTIDPGSPEIKVEDGTPGILVDPSSTAKMDPPPAAAAAPGITIDPATGDPMDEDLSPYEVCHARTFPL